MSIPYYNKHTYLTRIYFILINTWLVKKKMFIHSSTIPLFILDAMQKSSMQNLSIKIILKGLIFNNFLLSHLEDFMQLTIEYSLTIIFVNNVNRIGIHFHFSNCKTKGLTENILGSFSSKGFTARKPEEGCTLVGANTTEIVLCSFGFRLIVKLDDSWLPSPST